MGHISINRWQGAQGEIRHCPLDTHNRIRDNVIAGNLTFVNICREDCFYREQCRKKKKKKLIPSSLLPTKFESWNQGEKRHCPIHPSTSIQKYTTKTIVVLDTWLHVLSLSDLLCCAVKWNHWEKGNLYTGKSGQIPLTTPCTTSLNSSRRNHTYDNN